MSLIINPTHENFLRTPLPRLREPRASDGPAPQMARSSGARRHGGWAGCLFMPGTPCAREM